MAAPHRGEEPDKVFATNRQARFQYHILEVHEAGLVLTGPEVKSVRDARAVMKDAFATLRNGELWLHNMHISPYVHAPVSGQDPERARKLLLHRREIDKLERLSRLEGHTLVPLRLYLRNGRVKCEIAVAKGKKLHDKRQAAREETARREARDAMGRSRKGR